MSLILFCMPGLAADPAAAAPAHPGATLAALLAGARGNEPTFLGAQATAQAAQARARQALGAFLPQVSATANTTTNRRNYETRVDGIPEAEDKYNGNAWQVTISQPVWHYANFAAYREASSAADQAQYQVDSTEAELTSRIVSAWFDVLAARDGIDAATSQEAASRQEWVMRSRGAELGTAGAPESEEAHAKFEQARADALSAQNEYLGKLAALEQLVGPLSAFDPPVMNDDATLTDLDGDTLATWLSAAESGNPALRAARQGLEAADAEVSKQWAGHQPTVDLVATYGRNAQAVGGFPGQSGYRTKQNSVSLQLSLPIFSGGTQSAKVSEAVAQREKARQDVEAARRAAILAVKQAWFGWQAARGRAEAGREEMKAARIGLALARKGRESGVKSELDVRKAQQQWAAATKDWRKGRYDQIVSHVKLKAAVGAITVGDVAAIDLLFVAEPARTAAPGDVVLQDRQGGQAW